MERNPIDMAVEWLYSKYHEYMDVYYYMGACGYIDEEFEKEEPASSESGLSNYLIAAEAISNNMSDTCIFSWLAHGRPKPPDHEHYEASLSWFGKNKKRMRRATSIEKPFIHYNRPNRKRKFKVGKSTS